MPNLKRIEDMTDEELLSELEDKEDLTKLSDDELQLELQKEQEAAPYEEGLIGSAVEGAESLLGAGLEKVGRILSPLDEFASKYVSNPLKASYGAYQTGQGAGQQFKALVEQFGKARLPTTPESWKEIAQKGGIPKTSLSEVAPELFSKSGQEWLKLRKGGMLDVSPAGVVGGVTEIGLSPTSYLPYGAALKGSAKAASGSVKLVGKGTLKTIEKMAEGASKFTPKESKLAGQLNKISEVAQKGGQALKKTKDIPLKPNAKEIIKAAKDLNVPATSGMLSASEDVAKLEQALASNPSSMAKPTREMFSKLKTGLTNTTKEIMNVGEEGVKLTADEIGVAIKEKAFKVFEDKFNKLGNVYDKVANKFRTSKVPNLKLVSTTVNDIKNNIGKFKISGIQNKIKDTLSDLDQIKTLEDLRNFRSGLGKTISSASSGNEIDFVVRVNEAIDKAMEQNILSSFGKKSTLYKQWKKTNKAYANEINNFKQLIGLSKVDKIGRKGQLFDKLEKMKEEGVANKIFNLQNKNRLLHAQKILPEEFELFKKLKLAQLTPSDLSAKRLLTEIDKMPEYQRKMFFTPEKTEKLNALRTVIKAMPENYNPSATAKFLPWVIEAGQGSKMGGVFSKVKDLVSPSSALETLGTAAEASKLKGITSQVGTTAQRGKKMSLLEEFAPSRTEGIPSVGMKINQLMQTGIRANEPTPMDEFDTLPQANKYLELADKKDILLSGAAQQMLMKYPRFMQEKIKNELMKIPGAPTADKVMRLALPGSIKKEVLNVLNRVYYSNTQDEPVTFVPEEKRNSVRQDIHNNPALSLEEKANMIDQLNRHGSITNIKAITGF